MNTILRDISLIWTMSHCCILFMLLYESRFPKRKTNIITTVFMVPLISLNIANIIRFGTERGGQLITLSCVLPSLLFFLAMAKNRDTRFLFTFCIVDTVVLEVLLISNILDTYMGIGNYVVMLVSRLIIIPCLEFIVVRYIREPYHLLQQYTKKGWGILSLLAALFYVLMVTVIFYPGYIFKRPEYIPYLLLILILVPVMYITVLNVLWNQLKLFRANEENRMLSMQINMVNKRLEDKTEAENQMKLFRHNIKHRVLLLDDAIRNKDFECVSRYLNEFTEDMDKSTVKTYCENNCANVILSHYNSIADKKGIELRTDISLPKSLDINDTDFALILSNALDNAINALEKGDGCYIEVKAFIDDKLYLEIKNPYRGIIKFDGDIPVSDIENHGYGTKSIAAIVKSYGGIYSFVLEKGLFVFRCAI